ncbi:MAG: hypothetical protein HY904_26165 [Deltaproteobacteria bacterium]|nr:hypothetical protein [Deltaproteobacteria bacterium]
MPPVTTSKPPSPAAPVLDRNTVYWLEDTSRKLPPQIVGDVEYRAATRELCFYDTNRPHVLPARHVGGDAGGWRFEGAAGEKLVLRRLDRVTFEKTFRAVTSGAPAFKTDAELQKFYLGVIRSP